MPVDVRTAEAQAPKGPLQSPGLGAYALARGVWFGSATSYNYLSDQDYSLYNGNECSVITPESSMHPGSIQFANGSFAFANADTEVQWAQQRGIVVRGHYLINGPGANPAWLTTAITSAATAQAIMATHINTFMAHYRGRVKWINVVNESIKPSGGDSQGFVTNPFYQFLGTDPVNGYLALALKMARAADPTCKVGLNFDNCDDSRSAQAKQRVFVYNACRALIAAGCPLDWVGIEGHLAQDFEANFNSTDWVVWLARMANLGVKLHITELDVQDVTVGTNSARDTVVSTAVTDYIAGALTNPAVEALQVWQLGDRYSWWNNRASGRPARTDNLTYRPTVLSWGWNPKANYTAIKTAINAQRPGALPSSDRVLFFGQPPLVITGLSIPTGYRINSPSISIINNTGGGGGGNANYPNLPANYTSIVSANSHRAFHAVSESNWNNFDIANGSIVTDALAPINPTTVMQIKWPAGFVGGNAVFFQESGFFTAVRSVYVASTAWMSVGFKGHGTSGVDKKQWLLSDTTAAGNASVYLSFQGGGTNNFQPQIRTQGGGGAPARDIAPNVAPNTGFTMLTGVYYQLEVILTMNSPGGVDGVCLMWVRTASNGVLGGPIPLINVSDVEYQRYTGAQAQYNLLKFQPIYGGGQTDSVPADQFTRWDDLNIKGV